MGKLASIPDPHEPESKGIGNSFHFSAAVKRPSGRAVARGSPKEGRLRSSAWWTLWQRTL